MGKNGYALGFRRKIAHSGSHAETGAFPSAITAWLCVASEIPFIPPRFYIHIYTYISRFSVAPHYQQQLYLRPSFIVFFNFSHKWPTFAFTGESGYTLAFANRIAHSGLHAETGAFRTGPLSLPSERSARSQTSPGRVSERRTLPLLGLGRVYSEERREPRDSDALMRVAAPQASRPRWAALPAASMHSACFSGMERLDQAFRQSYYHTQ